jgi:hypothetical protein
MLLLKERINFLKYSFGTIINLGLVSFFWVHNTQDLIVYSVVLASSIINQYMLVKGLMLALSNPYTEQIEHKGMKVTFYLLGKTIILASAFYYATSHDQSKVFFAVILYIFQLIILGLSIRKVV